MKKLNVKDGLFVVLEGGEGSGKTTLAKNLEEHYKSLGYDVLVTREPGGTKVAEEIRNFVLNNNFDNYTELFLFLAARRTHILNTILPALDEGKIVICDRYVTSTLVYQGVMGNIPTYFIKDLMNVVTTPLDRGKCIYPDIEFLLNVDANVSMKRIENRNDNNKFDNKDIDYHKKVNKAYLYQIKKSNSKEYHIINANNNEDNIKNNIIYFIENYINSNKTIIKE